MTPPGWRRTPGGTLRRALGPLRLALFPRGPRTWAVLVELRADAGDEGEACQLAEAVASSWLEAHQAEREGVGRFDSCALEVGYHRRHG